MLAFTKTTLSDKLLFPGVDGEKEGSLFIVDNLHVLEHGSAHRAHGLLNTKADLWKGGGRKEGK